MSYIKYKAKKPPGLAFNVRVRGRRPAALHHRNKFRKTLSTFVLHSHTDKLNTDFSFLKEIKIASVPEKEPNSINLLFKKSKSK